MGYPAQFPEAANLLFFFGIQAIFSEETKPGV